MATTLDNGSVWPINSDNYNLCPDLSTAGNSLNVITYCVNVAARDAVTKFTGRTIWLATTGQYQTWTGARWSVGSTTLIGQQNTTPGTLIGTSYATVATAEITSLGGSLTLDFNAIFQNENSGEHKTVDIQWTVDGTGVGGNTFFSQWINPNATPTSAAFSVPHSVAAGAHTVNLQTRCSLANSCRNVAFALKVWENPI